MLDIADIPKRRPILSPFRLSIPCQSTILPTAESTFSIYPSRLQPLRYRPNAVSGLPTDRPRKRFFLPPVSHCVELNLPCRVEAVERLSSLEACGNYLVHFLHQQLRHWRQCRRTRSFPTSMNFKTAPAFAPPVTALEHLIYANIAVTFMRDLAGRFLLLKPPTPVFLLSPVLLEDPSFLLWGEINQG